MMLPRTAANRIFVPVEEDVKVGILFLQALYFLKDLGEAEICRFVKNDMYLLVHVLSPLPVLFVVIGL